METIGNKINESGSSECNPVSGPLPKGLEPFRKLIVQFEDDRGNDNGYFVHLVAGYWYAWNEVHFIHEDTIKECVAALKNLERCVCDECLEYITAHYKELQKNMKWIDYDLDHMTLQIVEGKKTFNELYNQSKNYLGDRTYQHIDYSITPEGRAAGWIYEYPYLKYNGKPYKEWNDKNITVEGAILRGHMKLQNTHTTHCG